MLQLLHESAFRSILVVKVLEEEEYTRRKEWYLGVGQRHYYFMNVGNGEVIDACRKASQNPEAAISIPTWVGQLDEAWERMQNAICVYLKSLSGETRI